MMMKVLIISLETWRDGTNGGNVLTNLFTGMDAEFAQIYCSAGAPDNNICTHYFQMTDAMAIDSLLHKRPMGRVINCLESNTVAMDSTDQAIGKVKRLGSSDALRVVRELVWAMSDYRNEALKKFVLDFDPDIIFAPHYGVTYMLSLTEYVAKLTGKPIISYISDDSYSLKHINFSPFFWMNRFVLRYKTRRVWKRYELIYTMTETQKEYMSKLGKPMKVLMKSASFGDVPEKKTVGTPIRLAYAGGIYLNRWKTLAAIADAIRELNRDGVKLTLDIYTGNEISSEINKKLNDGVHSVIHGSVSQEELKEIYHSSDIALHVESFDLKNRLAVRMSFSTKIVDCLSSGCAVMAVCEEKQGGMVYLKENDAAICVTDPKDIDKTLRSLADSPQRIVEYAAKAKQCCIRNHSQEQNRAMILEDFERYCK